MPAAARVGDLTAHASTPLTPMVPSIMGSPDVFIGKLPAWRVGPDVHVCPLSNGPSPHVGGPIVQGSSSVLINKFPAARRGDPIAEPGGTNKITGGLDSVQIGD